MREIFRLTVTGSEAVLHAFSGPDGCTPNGLVEGTDGMFYGTTYSGGEPGGGVVFNITAQGAFTQMHNFLGYPNEGAAPRSALIQASDGSFYGTTSGGGANNSTLCYNGGCGTVFKINTRAIFATLYSFCSQQFCTDGSSPFAELVQARDGNFYGTTQEGGNSTQCSSHGCGTLFQINSGGALVTLYSFGNPNPGSYPEQGMVQATDGTLYGTTSYTAFTVSFGQQMVPVAPCRLVDTRQTGQPIEGGTSQSFPVAQLGDCNIPSSASAYSLNVTVVPQGPLEYLTIWPTGGNQPVVSTMNSLDGRTKANAAIVPAGADGAVSVFASNTTDLVLDINGYFASPAGDLADGRHHPAGLQLGEFYPLAPCRVIDTRQSNGHLGSPSLVGGAERDFPVLESSCLQGINNPQAYSFNFTVVPTPHDPSQPLGYLTVWPQGGSQPTVSTLNNPTATTVANAAIVPAGTGGGISVFASNDTDMVVDINGYFAAPGTGGLNLYPVAPCRVLDTRNVNGGNPISGQYPVNVTTSPCAPPSSAQAYVFNATVVPSVPLGYLTLWPDGSPQPTVSTLNALDGLITSNMAIVPSTNSSIDAFASNLTQLVLDISSYFAP